MVGKWALGGLSIGELLRRTANESWEDGVFGQAARLAFYHFIAIFPALMVLLLVLARLSRTGAGMLNLLSGSFREILPAPAAQLVTGAIGDLRTKTQAADARVLAFSIASALWASHNASWAMIVGLNTAYETREDRGRWALLRTSTGLSSALLAAIVAALVVSQIGGEWIASAAFPAIATVAARWAVILALVAICLAIFYRFGPNLRRSRWKWSAPGAVFGAMLWVAATVAARAYFERLSNYGETYGRASAAAMLLMWLYLTSAAVLIGAEMNSEIKKAREERAEETPAPMKGPQLR